MVDRPRLRLVRGGHPEISVGCVRIVAAPEEPRPFEVDAVAFEEDTFLVLSADPVARDPGEPLIKILTEAHEVEPASPGRVVVREGRPLHLLAVVHDLGRDPTWREEWVTAALEGILRECETREIGSLALPPIGTLHGTLRVERFVALLRDALRGPMPASLERVWLIAPGDRCRYLLEILRQG
jgi:hypothetical protein